jgi:hypothetical protein
MAAYVRYRTQLFHKRARLLRGICAVSQLLSMKALSMLLEDLKKNHLLAVASAA